MIQTLNRSVTVRVLDHSSTWGQCYTTFLLLLQELTNLRNKLVVVPGKLFQPRFVGKAEAYQRVETLDMPHLDSHLSCQQQLD